MIKILVVDDDYSGKVQRIVNLLKTKANLNITDIDIVQDTVNARKKLSENSYDLLLLDMNLPISIGDEPSPMGGLDLLNRINENQITNYPHHIIGITSYKEIYNENKKDLFNHLWILIHYDETNDEWENLILNKVMYLIKSKERLYGNYFKKFDIAVVTALEDIELETVKTLPYNWTILKVPNDTTTIYYEGKIKISEDKEFSIVAASAPKMGMTSSAILTTKMCTHFQPKYLFMVGIAAGIRGKNNFGDILISETTWDWGSGKSTVVEGKPYFAPDQTQVTTDESILTKLKYIKSQQQILDNIKNSYPAGKKPTSELKMHIGPVATGSMVIEDDAIVEQIKSYQRKLIGVEMEIYGVMLSTKYCTKPSPIGICLKSVCDFGDTEKNDDWQYYAAYTSSRVMDLLIKELD
ncbi:phosphorylase family protein [Aliarcobacter butzleri]|uniref:phosphorylase family protein n=1 Tax=Aliarcobacter butzleri TaxID=28197 RepID=UPI0021B1758F|nr:hypothetical protein [Aliarcobacter butzleri]MCT7562072.1 hypothetical protein [Aliarcobacter butzleri]